MALEGYAPQNPDKVYTDVLSEARQACYKARDEFYACLERESNKKPTEIATVGLLYPVECKKCRDKFVNQCRPTWSIKRGEKDEALASIVDTKVKRVGDWVEIETGRELGVLILGHLCVFEFVQVKHFDRQYASKKKRLLDDNESRRGPLSLPQPYTFKPSS
ncbi:hypothetical protein RHMOL_Rhmol03G0282000 [Rhododendron molle]|uniref:Uncharacterized protein n=1 Tax=Rhododendron molle TaxID=49168 RepID=A0ACC0PJC7_RHOML|nr:hypothetical protein RHMOL_Rhmol03G0282000 [Rhododendron molle]